MENEEKKMPEPGQNHEKKKKLLFKIGCGVGAVAVAGAIVGIVFGVRGCAGGTTKPWWETTSTLTVNDIGKTEVIKINGKDHKVRLIGIDRDTDTNGDKLHTTWEFVNVITNTDGSPLTIGWGGINNYSYSNSTLCDYLGSDEFLGLFPEGLQKKLEYPDKASFRAVGEFQNNVYVNTSYCATNFFLLSYYEMFGETHPTEIRPPVDKETYHSYQGRYDYFTNNPDKANLVKHIAGTTTAVHYWLTSPEKGTTVVGTREGAVGINEQGDPVRVNVANEIAIAPAFCL